MQMEKAGEIFLLPFVLSIPKKLKFLACTFYAFRIHFIFFRDNHG